MSDLTSEKLQQAATILQENDIDCWLTFVRETSDCGDPVLPLILRQNLVWQSVLLVLSSGERYAIVGKFDDDAVRSSGDWTQVTAYVQSIREPLLDLLGKTDPQAIGINYSRDDVKADGLSHGMYLLLMDYLRDTPFANRLVSADNVIGALRARKTTAELTRIREAIASTDDIFNVLANHAQVGLTEHEIGEFVRSELRRRGLAPAWDPKQCPLVTTGPDSMIGHGIPSKSLKIEPGRILHIDFGVCEQDYCSDLQRVWYVPTKGEKAAPATVQQAFDTVRAAIEAAFGVLTPGVEGWQVDAAARQVVIDAGYPEYQHATGHHVGRSAHDGSGVLGPRWERYGTTVFQRAEPGNVFTLELGLAVDGRGYIGLEEMVLVTDHGCEYISNPQTSLQLLQS